jgi:hypothetical protein
VSQFASTELLRFCKGLILIENAYLPGLRGEAFIDRVGPDERAVIVEIAKALGVTLSLDC